MFFTNHILIPLKAASSRAPYGTHFTIFLLQLGLYKQHNCTELHCSFFGNVAKAQQLRQIKPYLFILSCPHYHLKSTKAWEQNSSLVLWKRADTAWSDSERRGVKGIPRFVRNALQKSRFITSQVLRDIYHNSLDYTIKVRPSFTLPLKIVFRVSRRRHFSRPSIVSVLCDSCGFVPALEVFAWIFKHSVVKTTGLLVMSSVQKSSQPDKHRSTGK